MKSAIRDILFGKRTSNTFQQSERAKELLSELVKSENEFDETIQDEKTAAAFERFKEALENLHLEESIDYYKEGFRFGFCLAMDVFAVDCAENGKK